MQHARKVLLAPLSAIGGTNVTAYALAIEHEQRRVDRGVIDIADQSHGAVVEDDPTAAVPHGDDHVVLVETAIVHDDQPQVLRWNAGLAEGEELGDSVVLAVAEPERNGLQRPEPGDGRPLDQQIDGPVDVGETRLALVTVGFGDDVKEPPRCLTAGHPVGQAGIDRALIGDRQQRLFLPPGCDPRSGCFSDGRPAKGIARRAVPVGRSEREQY